MQSFQFLEFLSILYINAPVLASFYFILPGLHNGSSVLVCYNHILFILNYWHVPGSWLALADLERSSNLPDFTSLVLQSPH